MSPIVFWWKPIPYIRAKDIPLQTIARPSKPTVGTQSAVYVAVASQYSSALIVKVNGVNVSNPSTGNYFSNASDALIRMGIHGAFADLRITFSSSLLVAGDNVISFTERKSGGDFQYDYLRLESPGTSLVSAVEPAPTVSNAIVSPNPFINSINLKLSSALTNAAVEIASIDGKIVHQEHIVNSGSDIHIDLPQLKGGIYLLRLTDNTSESIYKVIKI